MQLGNQGAVIQILDDLERGDFEAARQKLMAPRTPRLMIKDFVAFNGFKNHLWIFDTVPRFLLTENNKAQISTGLEEALLRDVLGSDRQDLKTRWETAKANCTNAITLTFRAQNLRFALTLQSETDPEISNRFLSTKCRCP